MESLSTRLAFHLRRLDRWKPLRFVLALFAVAILSHLNWLNPFATFTHTDWWPWQTDAVKQLFTNLSWGTWNPYSGIGGPNVQVNFAILYILWGGLANLGLQANTIVWLTFLVPILVLQSTAPFYLLKKLFTSNLVAFFGALSYITLIYPLARQTSHLPMVLIFYFAPLALLLLIKAVESNKFKDWLYLYFAIWISTIYELRVTSILVGLLVIYYFIVEIGSLKIHLRNILWGGAIFVGLSIFWILPTFFGGLGGAIGSLASRGVWGNALFDLQHALTVADSSWTGGRPNETFEPQPVPLYLYIVPLIAFLGPLIARIKVGKQKRQVIFFVVISCIGIFLTKQSAEPFKQAYSLMYDHLPGFNIFREASKFYLITGLGYLGLVGLALWGVLRSGKERVPVLFFGLSLAIVGVAGANLLPLINGTFGGMIVSRTMPADYSALNKFLSEHSTGTRTLWVPAISRWSINDLSHNRLSARDVSSGILSAFSKDAREAYPATFPTISAFMRSAGAPAILSELGVKYVILPTRDVANDDDLFRTNGDNRTEYADLLSSLTWLMPVPGSYTDLRVYQAPRAQPTVRTFSELVEIPDLDNFEDFRPFATTQLGSSEINFVDQESLMKTSNIERTRLSSLLDIISESKLEMPLTSSLYIDKSNKEIRYISNSSIAEFIVSQEGSLGEGSTSKVAIPVNLRTVLAIGSEIHPLDISGASERDLGAVSSDVNLYDTGSNNLIENGDFTAGKWKSGIDDCNKYNNQPKFTAYVEDVKQFSGKQALTLSTASHTPCTRSNTFSVEPGGMYHVQLKYLLMGSQRMGYEVEFDTGDVIQVDKVDTGGSWHAYDVAFTAPKNTRSARLVLKGYISDLTTAFAQTSYTDVAVYSLTNRRSVSAKEPSVYASSNFTNKELAEVKQQVSSKRKENLVPNSKFEQGLWQKEVGDCNRFDENPVIGQKIITIDGAKALELSAKSHAACTGPDPIGVLESSTYSLEFEYRNSPGAVSAVYVSFDDQNSSGKTYSLAAKHGGWNKFSKVIRTPYGAKNMSILFYAYGDDLMIKTNKSVYRNPTLYPVDNSLLSGIVVQKPLRKAIGPKVEYDLAQPTRISLKFTEASEQFNVRVLQGFHPGWSLTLAGKSISNDSHFALNGFADAWQIDTQKLCVNNQACKKESNGTYTFSGSLEFLPQRLFFAGVCISGLVLGFVLLVLAYRRKRA